jgi:alkylation response protein AidB-like acyl-CoA dehydrogenase
VTTAPHDHPLVLRARALAPMLRDRAADTELAGDIGVSSAAALREAGMFSLLTPERYTGHQIDLPAAVQAFVELGLGCGANSWVAMILSGGCAAVSLLDDEVRDEVWASDPMAAVGGVTALTGTGSRVPGGWVVSGRWQPASGIRHAQWAVLGVQLRQDDGQVEAAIALAPIEDVRIIDTWSVAGMQGTGSQTITAENLFVPDRRILSLPRLLAADYVGVHPDEGIGTLPAAPLLTGIVIGPVIGMVEAARELAFAKIRQRGQAAGSRHMSAVESPAVQLAMATAVSLVDTARLHGFRAVQDLDDAMHGRVRLDGQAAARILMDASVVSVSARRAVGMFLDVLGARSFAIDNPLQRIWRDIEVVCRHQLLSVDNIRETYGRAILGADN